MVNILMKSQKNGEVTMSNKKQSSVEWLEKEINKRGPMENNPPQWLKDLYKQAKAMHKKEIIDACNQKEFQDIDGYGIHGTISKGEEYYDQIYGDNTP